MRNKYGARKTEVNGIIFDSGAEAAYYKKLIDKEERGEIRGFTLQPRFLLQEGFKKNGVTHRAIHYVADFEVFHIDGQVSIIDVKGFETDIFKIKRKLFEERYPELALVIVKNSETKRRPGKTRTPEEQARARQRAERKARSKERRNKRQ